MNTWWERSPQISACGKVGWAQTCLLSASPLSSWLWRVCSSLWDHFADYHEDVMSYWACLKQRKHPVGFRWLLTITGSKSCLWGMQLRQRRNSLLKPNPETSSVNSIQENSCPGSDNWPTAQTRKLKHHLSQGSLVIIPTAPCSSWESPTDRGDLHLAYVTRGHQNKQLSSFRILLHERAVQCDYDNQNKNTSDVEEAEQTAGRFQGPSVGQREYQTLKITYDCTFSDNHLKRLRRIIVLKSMNNEMNSKREQKLLF